MKLWFVLLSLLFIFVAPAVYLFTDTLSASNEVHITATVPELESESSSNVSSDGGGGGSWSGQIINVRDDEEVEEEDEDGEEETEEGEENEPEPDNAPETDVVTDDEEVEEEALDEPAEPTSTNVYFGGYSFPNATISYSLNGEVISTIQADATGYFEGVYASVEAGENTFSFQAENYEGDESHLVSYAYTVQTASPVYISGVVLPPILDVSSEGDLEGIAIPGSEIQIYGVDLSDQSLHVVNTISVNPDGTYAIEFDLRDPTVYDQYYVGCEWEGLDCGFSQVIEVQMVGDSYKFVGEVFADFTQDVEVNFVDFAFIRAAFLSGKNNPVYDLNKDGTIDLVDFSLLNYQWTL